jgi:hypothetical protein
LPASVRSVIVRGSPVDGERECEGVTSGVDPGRDEPLEVGDASVEGRDLPVRAADRQP